MGASVSAPSAPPATALQVNAGATNAFFLTPLNFRQSEHGIHRPSNVAVKNADYVVTNQDFVIIGNKAGGALTITGLDAAANPGKLLYFVNKNTATMAVDFAGKGGVGPGNIINLPQYGCLLVQSDGVTWNILAWSGFGGGGGGGASRQAAANNAGDTTLGDIGANIILHTAVVTFTGAARTSKVALPITNRIAGDRASVKAILPATADIIVQVTNSTTAGTKLFEITTNGDALPAVFELEFDGAAWQPAGYSYPAATP